MDSEFEECEGIGRFVLPWFVCLFGGEVMVFWWEG